MRKVFRTCIGKGERWQGWRGVGGGGNQRGSLNFFHPSKIKMEIVPVIIIFYD